MYQQWYRGFESLSFRKEEYRIENAHTIQFRMYISFLRVFLPIVIAVLIIIVGGLTYSFVYRHFILPPVVVYVEPSSKLVPEEVIQLNILNASGQAKMSKKVMDFMRSRGFDVVEIGTYHRVTDTSFVLDRIGDSLSASRVAVALGISHIRVAIDSSLFLRNTVVVGTDYKSLRPFQ